MARPRTLLPEDAEAEIRAISALEAEIAKLSARRSSLLLEATRKYDLSAIARCLGVPEVRFYKQVARLRETHSVVDRTTAA